MEPETLGEYALTGPMVGKRVRIIKGARTGEIATVVEDMHPYVPVLGLESKIGPQGYFDGEWEEVE